MLSFSCSFIPKGLRRLTLSIDLRVWKEKEQVPSHDSFMPICLNALDGIFPSSSVSYCSAWNVMHFLSRTFEWKERMRLYRHARHTGTVPEFSGRYNYTLVSTCLQVSVYFDLHLSAGRCTPIHRLMYTIYQNFQVLSQSKAQ